MLVPFRRHGHGLSINRLVSLVLICFKQTSWLRLFEDSLLDSEDTDWFSQEGRGEWGNSNMSSFGPTTLSLPLTVQEGKTSCVPSSEFLVTSLSFSMRFCLQKKSYQSQIDPKGQMNLLNFVISPILRLLVMTISEVFAFKN